MDQEKMASLAKSYSSFKYASTVIALCNIPRQDGKNPEVVFKGQSLRPWRKLKLTTIQSEDGATIIDLLADIEPRVGSLSNKQKKFIEDMCDICAEAIKTHLSGSFRPIN